MSDKTDDVRSEDTTEETPQEEAQAAEQTPKPEDDKHPEFAKYDPRKAIYAKSDADRFKAPPEEKQEEPEEEPATEEKPTEEAQEEKPAAESEAAEEEEKETPREKRKRENLEAKAARLDAWEKDLTERIKGLSGQDSPTLANAAASVQPLPNMTEEQIEARYNELALESPYKAARFQKEVDAAREVAWRVAEGRRANAEAERFRREYEVPEEAWERMNDREFYSKYPTIMGHMESGNFTAAYIDALSRYTQEKLSASEQTRAAREALAQKRDDLKKKGAVLRVQTRVEPKQPPKVEAPKTKEELRSEYFARLKAQRQGMQHIPTELGPRK